MRTFAQVQKSSLRPTVRGERRAQLLVKRVVTKLAWKSVFALNQVGKLNLVFPIRTVPSSDVRNHFESGQISGVKKPLRSRVRAASRKYLSDAKIPTREPRILN